jgi:aldose 1-epimerase
MTNSEPLVRLSAGNLELLIAPGTGGSIAAFNLVDANGKHSIFRGSDGVPDTVLDAGSFPLVPYSNRIRDGRFSFRGRQVTIVPNMKGDASPLHGDGWMGAWDTISVSDRDCELLFSHAPGEWPWTYEARQFFELDASGLTVRLDCRNLSPDPMPCGLGFHPYFNCTPETVLDAQVTHAWTIDEKVLPVEKVAAEGRYDLSERRVCGRSSTMVSPAGAAHA